MSQGWGLPESIAAESEHPDHSWVPQLPLVTDACSWQAGLMHNTHSAVQIRLNRLPVKYKVNPAMGASTAAIK